MEFTNKLVQTMQGSLVQKTLKLRISFPEKETHFNHLHAMLGLLNYHRTLPFCKTHIKHRLSTVPMVVLDFAVARGNVRRGNKTDFSVKQME